MKTYTLTLCYLLFVLSHARAQQPPPAYRAAADPVKYVSVTIHTLNQWGGDAIGSGIIIEDQTEGTQETYLTYYLPNLLLVKNHRYYIYAINLPGAGVTSYTHRTYGGRVQEGQTIWLSVDQAFY